MTNHSHKFVESYQGLVGFGADRRTDENTIIYYLQKFSDDQLMQTIVKRMSHGDLEAVFQLISQQLKKHLSEQEYHDLFLKNAEY